MTFFKGQGANQALADALTLAKCLDLSTLDRIPISLRKFEREMVQRAAPRALASRQAAHQIHSGSIDALREAMIFADFQGNPKDLVCALKHHGVSISTPNLLSTIRDIINQL
mmetsp:Transcript_9695/g.11956  ORF Transcript_9695/g.11956 Transcript_9695/m.11956 type:complete len:112 (-) Transcript_9695:35-370(-)